MNQEKIGKFIKDIRKKNNLTQQELAEKLGVTYQAVSKWENGKNIPDIAILRQISEYFKVDINEILEGEKKTRKRKKYLILFILILLILIFLIMFLILHNINNNNFEFKTITTTCDEFNITGSAAYNSDKTSIYISNINYCGTYDDTIYNYIECTLYESYGNNEIKIDYFNNNKKSTLTEFLKETKINVNDYSSSCKEFSKSKLYLEINATDSNNKITTYKIPIILKDNC